MRTLIRAGLAAITGLALVLAIGQAQAVQVSPATAARAAHPGLADVRVAVSRTATLLYSQDNDFSCCSDVSQYYGKGIAQNAQAADDFTVPKGKTWAITEVKVAGEYNSSAASAASETVFFYQNTVKGKEDIPGKPIKKETLKGTPISGPHGGLPPGSFAISGIRGVSLPAGHYWVSVRANLAIASGVEWGWDTRTVQHGSPAVWENPPGGYGTGCYTWTNVEKCGLGSGQLDLMFALYGSSGS